jgi:hypothetical protein
MNCVNIKYIGEKNMHRPFYRNKFSSDTLLQKDILFEDAQRSALTDLAAIGGLAGGMTLGSAIHF